MATNVKQMGRPKHTPAFLAIIRSTPVGEVVVVGIGGDRNGEAFASYQAADYHKQNIKSALPKSAAHDTVTIMKVPGAVVEHVTREGRNGRTYLEEIELPGWYLILKGRKRSRQEQAA